MQKIGGAGVPFIFRHIHLKNIVKGGIMMAQHWVDLMGPSGADNVPFKCCNVKKTRAEILYTFVIRPRHEQNGSFLGA